MGEIDTHAFDDTPALTAGQAEPAGAANEPTGTEPPPAALAWARHYLTEHLRQLPCSFHAELLHDAADDRRRLLARIAPRGHAKSTLLALAFPLWCVCQRRRRNIVIITYERTLAEQFVADIRAEIEGNERILADYGDLLAPQPAPDFEDCPAEIIAEAPVSSDGPRGPAGRRAGRRLQGSPRRRDRFTTNTGITVQARSVGASLRGTRIGAQRPDLIICDDIETDELARSRERRDKLEAWLRRVVLPALALRGRVIVLGSLLHHDSLLARLRDRRRFPRWDYRVYRALEAAPDTAGGFRLRALWPDRWSVERLNEERERLGTLAFEQEYQANPHDEAAGVFRPAWLHRYDEAELQDARLTHLIAVDPASGVSGGDFFALWVGAVDTVTGVIYTRELTLERIGIVDQIRRIVAAAQRWKPVKIGIEVTAYQAALRQMLEEISRVEQLYLPIVPLRHTGSKIARIEGAAPFFENGTFRLPPVLMAEVERQFMEFPSGAHDDAPDVCAMGIELARSLRGMSIAALTPQSRRRGPAVGGWDF